MFRYIEENLVRQNKAMVLLQVLFQEEFSRLLKSDAVGVSRLELSIQELIRQLASERGYLRSLVQDIEPGARRVSELYGVMDQEKADTFAELVQVLDKTEQGCATQAAKNHELAMALHDQSKALLNFLHNEIRPKHQDSYSAKGRFANPSSQASLLRGRL